MIQLIIFFIVLTVLITLILNTGVIRKHIIDTWSGIAYHYKSKKGTISLIEYRKRYAEMCKEMDMKYSFSDTPQYEIYNWNDTEHYETYEEVMNHIYNRLT